ncbi:Nascent polypeptide-associated complex subunit beta [Mortierella sp. AD011]|nr:Nascent polypeptide-associated complex subunit beta [Mortierella sp. AD010]KAF9401170.1 Nascent polypeptide-associated complex subunit beta [Mortierella sp. AD011]
MNPEKLAKLQANANRSKGAPRRVIKKVHRPVAQDDRKLQAALEKLSLVAQPYVEEVNMFMEEGTVIHFRQPKVHASYQSNTYAIYGRGEEKELTELVPGILNQLGPDSLNSLRKLAETYQKSAAGQAALAAEGDDDEVPDLVESFEDASIEETKETKEEAATA